MTQTIEQLQAKIAALELEVARLRETTATKLIVEAHDFGQFSDDFNQPQARSVRKAIRELCEALSTPFTPTVLPELIEKVEKITLERCAVITAWSIIDMPTTVEFSTVRKYSKAIRALPVGHIKLEELL